MINLVLIGGGNQAHYTIDIIEKEAPGTYFNFYNIDFSTWMTIPHAGDQVMSNN